ncbi:hypothetical protein BH18ACI5_BH18ACI5_28230 [soil metagenome]
MRDTLVTLAVLALASFGVLAQQAVTPTAPKTAAAAIAAAIESLGGEALLKAVQSIKIDTIGHEWALEQSERPEGPWMTHYSQRTELRDVAGQRLRRQTQMRDWNFGKWTPETPATQIIAGGVSASTNGQRWRPGSGADLREAAETFALSPERLLLTARDAADLTAGPPKTLQGVANHSVTFTWEKRPVRLFLNSWTNRPTMLQIVRDDTFGIWGDVTEQRWYSWWDLQKGLWYPRQVTVEWNGYPFKETSVMDLVVDAPLTDADFEIPAETKTAFDGVKDRPSGLSTLTLDPSKIVDIAPNIALLPGNWNVLLVKQPDGIVIFEGPISSHYSETVIAAAKSKFPGTSIKAVITTSDAWPHIGGMREYVARKIPVYALDLNLPILERLMKAARTTDPDALAKTAAAPIFRPVGRPVTLGTGDLRIDLIPVRGEMGERMMIAYLPGRKLAYSSDLIQPGRTPGSFFMPGMIAEVTTALMREKAGEPATVVGMHLMPTPWEQVVAALKGMD